jgi:hypothetical protein
MIIRFRRLKKDRVLSLHRAGAGPVRGAVELPPPGDPEKKTENHLKTIIYATFFK